MVRRVDGTQRVHTTSTPKDASKAEKVASGVEHLNPNHFGSLSGRVTAGRPTGERKFTGGFREAS